MWRSGAQASGLLEAVDDFLAACAREGSLTRVVPQRTARQFVFLLATEARTVTAYGASPLEPSDRDRILQEAVDLFTSEG